MSIHAAKGLEFPVVCVADLGRAPNKRIPELLVQDDRIGLRLAHLDGSDSTPALEYQQLSEERQAEEALEEDRVLYVAMTRARERLLLSGAIELPGRSSGANGTTISWLAPALVGDLGELEQQLAPGAGLEGIVLPAATGGGDLRCMIATPSTAAGLPAQAPAAHGSVDSATDRGAAGPPTAQAGRPAPTRVDVPPGPQLRGVNPAQLTLEDEVAALAPGGDPSSGGPPAQTSAPPRLVAVAPPAPIELQTASYSSLKELERCGYRYYLERVLGLQERGVEDPAPGPRGRALDALARGSLVHRVLELHDFATGAGPSMQEVELAASGLGLDPGAGALGEIAELLGTALREAPGKRIAAAAEVWREQPFAYPAGERLPLLTGVIDVLARERDGGYLVIDYKSDAVASDDDLEVLVARDYALQRELYALAVLRGGAERVEVQHWFLERPREWASASFGRGPDGLAAGVPPAAPAGGASGRLRRQSQTPSGAVRDLPGTIPHVLLAGERDDGLGASARGQRRLSSGPRGSTR